MAPSRGTRPEPSTQFSLPWMVSAPSDGVWQRGELLLFAGIACGCRGLLPGIRRFRVRSGDTESIVDFHGRSLLWAPPVTFLV